MITQRLTVTFVCLMVLFVPVTSATLAHPATPTVTDEWQITCVDCPKYFENMSDHSLRLDPEGHLHIAYGGDHLYYAWREGTLWHYETVDDSPEVGSAADLALDASYNPHIAYVDKRNNLLKYAHWTGTEWDLRAIDSAATIVASTSLALDMAGNPSIAYSGYGTTLKYAHWTGSTWEIQIVDNSVWARRAASLAIDSTDIPHIGYFDTANDDLKYAVRVNGSWAIETVDHIGSVGWYPSLALDSRDRPHVSYVDDTNNLLKYASRGDTEWTTETVAELTVRGDDTSLAIEANGNVHIGYITIASTILNYAHRSGTDWETELVVGGRLRAISLDLDPLGTPFISYLNLTGARAGNLNLAHLTDTGWQIEIADIGKDVGRGSSLAFDSGGFPRIAYTDFNEAAVKYARWTGSIWEMESVNSVGQGLGLPSLSLNAQDDQPHMCFREGYFGTLKYVWRTGTEWQMEEVDALFSGDYQCSIALDSYGRPHIAYTQHTGTNDWVLKIASRTNGGQWQIETVDDSARVGGWASIAIDHNDIIGISYTDDTDINDHDLRYARQMPSGQWQIEIVDGVGNVGGYCSLALDTQGRPHISYRDETNNSLKYARWTGAAWQIEEIDRQEWGGIGTSLVLDSEGHPHISYYLDRYQHGQDTLKYAHWTGTSWVTEVIAVVGEIGDRTSLALNSEDLPGISYFDGIHRDLLLATYHWPTAVTMLQLQAASEFSSDLDRQTDLVEILGWLIPEGMVLGTMAVAVIVRRSQRGRQ